MFKQALMVLCGVFIFASAGTDGFARFGDS
jgi:hypothetical protein